MSTLENQLETAYAKVARQYEPTLADPRVSFRLATQILDQPVSPDTEEGEDSAQVPVPYILLKATRTDESTPAPYIFAVDLEIEAGDNAQPASDGLSLEELFRRSARPLFYQTLTDESTDPPTVYAAPDALAKALSAAVPNFNCIALKERAGGTSMENEGSIVKRMINATFYCATLAAAA